MHIDCHKAKILKSWNAKNGRLFGGTVLVEFTLYDNMTEARKLRSQLVEYVLLPVDPDYHEAFKIRKLEQRACEQVRRYFDGAGAHENIFAETPEPVEVQGLSAEQEADLQAELRSIELEFKDAHLPMPDQRPAKISRQPAPA